MHWLGSMAVAAALAVLTGLGFCGCGGDSYFGSKEYYETMLVEAAQLAKERTR